MGFEHTDAFTSQHFQCCAFNLSATPPNTLNSIPQNILKVKYFLIKWHILEKCIYGVRSIYLQINSFEAKREMYLKCLFFSIKNLPN